MPSGSIQAGEDPACPATSTDDDDPLEGQVTPHRRIGLSRVIRPSGSRTRHPGQITDPQWQRGVAGQNSLRRGKTCVCPMVVSQWGLNSKNNRGKTSPGHSMVVSQWSSPERRARRRKQQRKPLKRQRRTYGTLGETASLSTLKKSM